MSTDNTENKVEALAAELAKAKREIDILQREKRRVGLSFHRIPETGHDISRLWTGDFPYLQKLPTNSFEKQPSDDTFNADANTVLIEADNLGALMAMQLTHKGKIDVIYIDPPYNTGNNDFIYNDARKSSIKDVEGASSDDYERNLDGKARMIGKDDPERHSLWLSFMERRLWLAKALLSDRGVIFVSIDDNEQARLKVLMDSVFGESNFAANLIWQKKYGGGNDSKYAVTEHEYIYVYIKGGFSGPLTSNHTAEYLKRYSEQDSKGRYFWDTLARPGLKGAIEVKIPFNGDVIILKGGSSQNKVDRMVSDGDIKIDSKSDGSYSVKFKQRLSDSKVLRSILNRTSVNVGGTSDGKVDLVSILGEGSFSYPKPISLVKTLVAAVSSKDAIVLDFFAGSGTTAHAVAELNKEDGGNRQCILVTHGDEDGKNIAEDVTAERMKRVLSGKNWADGKEHEPLTGSLFYYKLLFAPKTSNPMTAMETMQTRFTGIAALEQNAHVELENTSNYTVLTNSAKLVVVWKNEDALLYEPELEFYPLLKRLKKEHSALNHIVYTPSNQSSTSDEYGVEPMGWNNYSYPMEYIGAHAGLLERMKRNKTMLQPYNDSEAIEGESETAEVDVLDSTIEAGYNEGAVEAPAEGNIIKEEEAR